ncbi:MAG: DUF1934 domain-containing protein [Clostridia bacterium]|nr:DUF1934 domain-containing protein [Clostridia bacterium]
MPIPVLLRLTSSARNEDGDETPMSTTTRGILDINGNVYSLRYEDVQEDPDDHSVLRQNIRLDMQSGQIEMTREGDYGTSMMFVRGKRFEGIYHTPFGEIDMAVYATRVDTNLAPEKGGFHLQYQLDTQGRFASMLELKLDYIAIPEKMAK